MDLQIFILGSLFTVIGTLVLRTLNSMNTSLKEAGKSVAELNVKVAVVIQALEYHDERIKKLEEKIE